MNQFGLRQDEVDYCERVVCLGNAANKHVTMMLAHRAIADGIAGDFAECGVLSGGHPALMAYVARHDDSSGRKIHLYDSFQGAPMAGLHDDISAQELHGVNPDRHTGKFSGRSAFGLWQTEQNMVTWDVPLDRLVYHIGWFQEVMPRETAPVLALLRMDCNFYDSTLPIMEHLYSKMPSGAFIISDDWGSSVEDACRRATMTFLDYDPNPTPVPGQETTVWWRKP